MKLKSKFAYIFVVYLFIFGAINVYIASNVMTETISKEVVNWGALLVTHLSDTLVEDMLQQNVLSIRETIKDFKYDNPSVAYIYVVDFNGRIIASTFRNGFPEGLIGFNSPGNDISVKPFRNNGREIFDISAPAVKGIGGELHVGISKEYINQIVGSATKTMSLWGILITLTGGIVVFISIGALTKPMELLIKGIERTIKGDYSYRIPVNSQDEIGQVSKVFNDMQEEIDDENRLISKYLKKLETTINNLKKSKNNYKSLVESIEDGIISVSPDGIVRSWNRSAEKIFQINRVNIIGKRITELFPIKSIPTKPVEIELKNNNKRFVKISMMKALEGEKYIIIARNITEERLKAELDRKLKEYEKLASVGQIAAEISHNINTPLTNITLSAELLLMDSKDERVKENLRKIISYVELCSNVVSNLLKFAKRGDEVKKEKVDILMLLDRALETCLVGHENIRVYREYKDNGIESIHIKSFGRDHNSSGCFFHFLFRIDR